jgi:16S rRNA (guanine527-N7)-methyltransferase
VADASWSQRDRELLARGATELGVGLDDLQLDAFAGHARLVEDWNRRFNLTRIRGPDVVPFHFLDSLTVLSVVGLERTARVLDIGSGAGFPGIPLRIARPGITLALLEATRKKVEFLRAVVAELPLAAVEAVHGRAEELGRHPEWRQRFDVVVARAVARLAALAEYMLPFVRPGGVAVAMKGAELDAEIDAALPAIEATGGRLRLVAPVVLPGTHVHRNLVLLEKVAPTPARFPRHPGDIKGRKAKPIRALRRRR